MKVSFILGAGFSRNAGLPLVNEIWNKLTLEDLEEQILHFNSSEWKWKDTANEAEQNNGRLTTERIPIGYFLKSALTKFKELTEPEKHNYEEFYQWLLDIDILGEVWKELKEKTKEYINTEFDENAYVSRQPISLRDVIFCFIHLIDDLLWPSKPFDEYAQLYDPYLDVIQQSERASIYTLNHDHILETLLEQRGIPYSDGFSNVNSPLRSPEDKEPIKVFCNTFNEKVRLIKLHGSIDQYKYHYLGDTDKAGQIDYFKTLDYYAKHRAEYVDEQGIVQQNVTTAIEPQFITGRNKLNLIQSDSLYSALYSDFQRELPGSDLLVINGYSYLDPHVNDVIESSKDSIGCIININPGADFPFVHPNVKNINPLEEEVKLV